jgi:hypothetical protein
MKIDKIYQFKRLRSGADTKYRKFERCKVYDKELRGIAGYFE